MDLETALQNFIHFLTVGFPNWEKPAQCILEMERGYLDETYDDWAQANWEWLVERAVCQPGEYLELYGSGSDYEMDIHSRVFFHTALPTHEIKCRAVNFERLPDELTGREIDPSRLNFERFVSINEKWWDVKPPLKFVMLTSKENEPYFFPLEKVTFSMERKSDL